jgi:hypothetical protein
VTCANPEPEYLADDAVACRLEGKIAIVDFLWTDGHTNYNLHKTDFMVDGVMLWDRIRKVAEAGGRARNRPSGSASPRPPAAPRKSAGGGDHRQRHPLLRWVAAGSDRLQHGNARHRVDADHFQRRLHPDGDAAVVVNLMHYLRRTFGGYSSQDLPPPYFVRARHSDVPWRERRRASAV